MSGYREQRLQPWWLLGLSLLMAVSLGIAYGAAINFVFGTATGLAGSAAALGWWWHGRQPIEVSADGLRVGRMLLAPAAIGRATPLSAADFAVRTSTAARADDVNSLLRRANGGVVVEVNAPTDPFRAWVIGSAEPERLAAAVAAVARS